MIKIDNLNVKLGSSHILKNININININNSIIGLFGPNGAGKTTLLTTLTGFINKYRGTISGLDKRKISYLPDKPFLYGFMTLKLAIEYYSDAFHDFDYDKAIRLFGKLKLSPQQKIAECSKGMIEQIHMILALCRNVNVYIFDEPLASVDPLTRDDIMTMIKEERYPNSVVIISTHLISDVESLFDEVIMIKDGEIVLHESVKSLKHNNNLSLEKIFKEKLK
ncbi:ATP-binding cassette domain-containing protein [Dethiothermospora halolimnae]|uniref:ATP-binding cassette domain-containing protein n=1 Tax=Dethiothermospora halolimnae TaxID=3114390 RepID=UPI003CCBE3CC